MKGPTVQDELFAIILRFRTHSLVMTADLTKMYRQIRVDDEDANYQLIVWRNEPQEQLKTYKLVTVTYGTTSAPFLATRCLNQLAEEEENNYPLAAPVVKRDFYVDDLLTGTETLEEAYQLRDQLINLLRAGGFEIRKWRSNSESFITETQKVNPQDPVLTLDKDKNLKTLGLLWNSSNDTLLFCINLTNEFVAAKNFTKRKILSIIAQIFDPLGLLGPVITVAKLIMQQLWQQRIDWDELVPPNVHNRWVQFYTQLKSLNNLNINRRIANLKSPSIELHAFCDASQNAYGVCIYIRSVDEDERVTISLVCSKSRVAPLKTITLPRLELSGALLSARLVKKVKSAMLIDFNETYFWTDSTVVLSWIHAPANTWNTFVSNRVAEIQSLTDISQWHHVTGKTNPADGLSRGKLPSDIIEDQVWWEGPPWLQEQKESWPNTWQQTQTDFGLEKRKVTQVHAAFTQENEIITKHSSLVTLQRQIAYILRFKNNTLNQEHRNVGRLTLQELDVSLRTIVRIVQEETFHNEIKNLSKNQVLDSRSPLLTLNPFLDKNKILRVGGRLGNSDLRFEQKHPAILSKNHHFTKLVVEYYHKKLLHAGAQSVLAATRNLFWIISGRSYVQKILKNCITCFKANPKPLHQIMGDLSKERTDLVHPFYHTGVDYGGPMLIKEHHGRGRVQMRKCYIAVFVCFATKAIHIELVSNLTTECFINALKRFISRRGGCSQIFSDNGTNFVGANRELQELYKLVAQEDVKDAIHNFTNAMNITWKFIPPRSPHVGGLWEAAIKSVKYHIKRVIGKNTLTFEEYYTVLTQIEACLNSRPLTPLSSNPDDLTALTPSHFLLGSSFAGIPEPDIINTPINRLSRWQHIMKLKQDIWRRWSQEYVTELQKRNKWKKPTRNLEEGDLVIIVDDLKSSLHWPLGRVMSVHPGKDGFVRIATVKTASGSTRRAVTKLCLLPVEDIERPAAFQGSRNVQ